MLSVFLVSVFKMDARGHRVACPSCGRSRAAYCEDCVLVLEQPPPAPLRLPCKFDIVQHGETNARSTALAAALLAPVDTRLYRHAGTATSRRCNPLDLQLPEYDAASTVVLFPEGPGTGVVGQCPPFERVVVLESNWKKARGLLQHPRLAGLRRVQLPAGLRTDFCWRRGDGSFRGAVEEGLSSIEAIYHCCRLLGAAGESYEGLLRYFRRTQQLVEARGSLPASRQEARAQHCQHKRGTAGAAGAAGVAVAAAEEEGGAAAAAGAGGGGGAAAAAAASAAATEAATAIGAG